jgi:hypothetical protein
MFYCIACQTLHPIEARPDLLVFKTGFHVLIDTRYPAGYCGESSELASSAIPDLDGHHDGEDKQSQADRHADTQRQPDVPSWGRTFLRARVGI